MIALSKDDFHVSKTPPTELVPAATGTSARHVITAIDLHATCRARLRVPREEGVVGSDVVVVQLICEVVAGHTVVPGHIVCITRFRSAGGARHYRCCISRLVLLSCATIGLPNQVSGKGGDRSLHATFHTLSLSVTLSLSLTRFFCLLRCLCLSRIFSHTLSSLSRFLCLSRIDTLLGALGSYCFAEFEVWHRM